MPDKKPFRTYSAEQGQKSIDEAGPDALEQDIDTINAMFDPNATHVDGKQGGIGTSNIKPGSFTDMLIGPRTVNDQIADAPANEGTFTQIMSWMARTIRLVTGETSWLVAPAKNFKQVTQETEEAVQTANAAESKADSAVITANDADSKADGAVFTAANALGQDTVEPYTGALGAMKIASDTKDDWLNKESELNQALSDVNDAVAAVDGKADVAYVDQVAENFTLGAIPDGSLGDEKFNQELFDKINQVDLDYGLITTSADKHEDYGAM